MNSDHINRSAIRTRVTQAQAGNPTHLEHNEATYGNRHEHFEHKFMFIVSIEGLGSVPRCVGLRRLPNLDLRRRPRLLHRPPRLDGLSLFGAHHLVNEVLLCTRQLRHRVEAHAMVCSMVHRLPRRFEPTRSTPRATHVVKQ